MGMFNNLKLNMRCPVCNKSHDFEIEFKFGLLDLHEYSIGDKVEWPPFGYPTDGRFNGEGYAVCEASPPIEARHEFLVDVLVRNGLIVGAVPRLDREVHIKVELK